MVGPGFEARSCGTTVYASNLIDVHHNFIYMCHHRVKLENTLNLTNNNDDFSNV